MKYFARSLVCFVLLCILSLFFLPMPAHAQEVKQPERVKIGIYITQLYDLDLPNKSFDAVFWMWSFSKNAAFNLKDNVDIVNARSIETSYFSKGVSADAERWETAKYTANMVKNWDLTDFPFDKQVLQIYMESILLQSPDMVFIADEKESGIDANIDLGDWKVIDFKLLPFNKVYNSLYASQIKMDGQYARLVAEVTIKRNGMRKFMQYLGVTYLACFLALCIYFLPIASLETRITLMLGAIFAAVGNKILLDDALPPISALTLVDKIEMTIFLLLCYTLVMTTITARLWHRDHHEVARTVNRVGFISSFAFLLITNMVLLIPPLMS